MICNEEYIGKIREMWKMGTDRKRERYMKSEEMNMKRRKYIMTINNMM